MPVIDWSKIDYDWLRKQIEAANSDPDFYRKMYLQDPFPLENIPLEGEFPLANRQIIRHTHVTETDTEDTECGPK